MKRALDLYMSGDVGVFVRRYFSPEESKWQILTVYEFIHLISLYKELTH